MDPWFPKPVLYQTELHSVAIAWSRIDGRDAFDDLARASIRCNGEDRWWVVMDSNHRALTEGIYSPSQSTTLPTTHCRCRSDLSIRMDRSSRSRSHCRSGRIRTDAPLSPRQMRYQAALRPDNAISSDSGVAPASVVLYDLKEPSSCDDAGEPDFRHEKSEAPDLELVQRGPRLLICLGGLRIRSYYSSSASGRNLLDPLPGYGSKGSNGSA